MFGRYVVDSATILEPSQQTNRLCVCPSELAPPASDSSSDPHGVSTCIQGCIHQKFTAHETLRCRNLQGPSWVQGAPRKHDEQQVALRWRAVQRWERRLRTRHRRNCSPSPPAGAPQWPVPPTCTLIDLGSQQRKLCDCSSIYCRICRIQSSLQLAMAI